MFSLPFRIAEYIGRKKRNGMTLFAYAFYTLFCLSRYMPIRQICEDYRVTVSAMGLIAYVLNENFVMRTLSDSDRTGYLSEAYKE